MAWDWVAPTAGGVVGLAGVAVAWLTSVARANTDAGLAQWQHETQRLAGIRDERHGVYTEFLSKLNEVDQLCQDAKDQPTAIEAIKAALALQRLRPKVLLVGPLAIHDAVEATLDDARATALAVTDSLEGQHVSGDTFGTLLGQMMLVLGYATVEEGAALPDEEDADQPRTNDGVQ
jgi:hypothetical protein